MAPAQVSIPSPSQYQRHRPQRNPAREKSKLRFYTVKNGLNGDDVYSCWGQAHPFCWDPSSEYFFQGYFCKRFNSYNEAWNFLLDIPKEPEMFSNIQDSTIPLEPPETTIPKEPDKLTMNHHQTPHHHPSSHIVPPDATDNESMATYDYNTILQPHHRTIPQHVHVKTTTTNDTTVSFDGHHATPFLTIGSEEGLPRYTGKSTDDIHEFLFKLRPFLRHESINDYHSDCLDPLS